YYPGINPFFSIVISDKLVIGKNFSELNVVEVDLVNARLPGEFNSNIQSHFHNFASNLTNSGLEARKDMNASEGLEPDNTGLRLFFADTTLYVSQENSDPVMQDYPETERSEGSENPANPIYSGTLSSGLLMVFSYPQTGALHGAGGEMVKRLIENPQAMNKKLEEIGLLNISDNKNFSLEELIDTLKPAKVLVW